MKRTRSQPGWLRAMSGAERGFEILVGVLVGVPALLFLSRRLWRIRTAQLTRVAAINRQLADLGGCGSWLCGWLLAAPTRRHGVCLRRLERTGSWPAFCHWLRGRYIGTCQEAWLHHLRTGYKDAERMWGPDKDLMALACWLHRPKETNNTLFQFEAGRSGKAADLTRRMFTAERTFVGFYIVTRH